MSNKGLVAAYTLGCKVNMYDTEAMLELFKNNGYEITSFDDYADIYIINTCTVTNLGDKKSRQIIRRARHKNPDAVIAAVGCYAQVAPDEVSKIEGVNLVLGTKERSSIVQHVEQFMQDSVFVNNVSDVFSETAFEELSIENLNDRTRAFLKIQEGCDRFCAFCIIPYARGRVRSRNPESILSEVRRLAANEYKEIVLTGIHVASYGKDLNNGMNLLDVMEMIHGVDKLERIRLSSIEPLFIDETFANRVSKIPKLCDHFHLSLQSGCDRTLKRMNRRYTTAQYEEAVTRLREVMPDVAITTDVIVGFPGETEEDFHESISFVEKVRLAGMHVFQYSPKTGTPAADFKDQVEPQLKADRSAAMLKLGEELKQAFLEKNINKAVNVLYEKKIGDNLYEGHSTNYMTVHTKSATDIINKILTVQIVKAGDGFVNSTDVLQ